MPADGQCYGAFDIAKLWCLILPAVGQVKIDRFWLVRNIGQVWEGHVHLGETYAKSPMVELVEPRPLQPHGATLVWPRCSCHVAMRPGDRWIAYRQEKHGWCLGCLGPHQAFCNLCITNIYKPYPSISAPKSWWLEVCFPLFVSAQLALGW